MPHATEPSYEYITVTPLHPTFGAEVSGVDFSQPVPNHVFQEIKSAIIKYGVLVFRSTRLNNSTHISFSRLFGHLDDITPYLSLGRLNRFHPHTELFDVSNLNDDGTLVSHSSLRFQLGLGNTLFHVDSSFNPRRAGYSLLLAHELPPAEYGGDTEFADTRTACDELPESMKTLLHDRDFVGAHSLMHSRRKACPESEYLQNINPEDYPFGRHRIVQVHEGSGRRNLYVANHLHHLELLKDESVGRDRPQERFERVPEEEGGKLIEKLLAHATQPKYILKVEWNRPGDLVVWDNTAVMHRAVRGGFEGKYRRDMRRTTVHDGSSLAWGENERVDKRMGLP